VKKVVVLDYGSGNLRSAQRAVERVGASVEVTADAAAARSADGLIVPGVGAYAACMAGIDAVGAREIIADFLASGRPLLGICVGMQVLFDSGDEHGVHTEGLGVLTGSVSTLTAPILPHMGWNTVSAPRTSHLFAGLDPQTRFYFVHSYAARPDTLGDTAGVVTLAEHGEPFVAAIEDGGPHGTVSATQFHPEKSGDAGAVLLRNWLDQL
jgi:glutamine amidotransferase